METEVIYFVYKDSMPLWGPFYTELEAVEYFDKITTSGSYSIVRVEYSTVSDKIISLPFEDLKK